MAQTIICSPWVETKGPFTVLNYYSVCFDCFPFFLHLVTSLIKRILWLKFVHRQRRGWGHREGGQASAVESCSVSAVWGSLTRQEALPQEKNLLCLSKWWPPDHLRPWAVAWCVLFLHYLSAIWWVCFSFICSPWGLACRSPWMEWQRFTECAPWKVSAFMQMRPPCPYTIH